MYYIYRRVCCQPEIFELYLRVFKVLWFVPFDGALDIVNSKRKTVNPLPE